MRLKPWQGGLAAVTGQVVGSLVAPGSWHGPFIVAMLRGETEFACVEALESTLPVPLWATQTAMPLSWTSVGIRIATVCVAVGTLLQRESEKRV